VPSRANAVAKACHHQRVQEIEISGDMIRLGQLLKLSNLADSGADARDLLLAQGVTVNGEVEVRRGRQLHRGDVVAIGEQALRVA
jgi:ribosome-associated protein